MRPVQGYRVSVWIGHYLLPSLVALPSRRDTASQTLPVAAAANAVYVAGKAQNLGEDDFSAVLEVLMTGRRV